MLRCLLSINKNININGKIDTTKNETSNRIIPIFKPTREILKYFTGTTGRIYPYSKNAIQNDFQDVITKCNFKNKYTIHSLRHTFVTFCQDNQIPEHIIQSWIGHTIGSQVTKKVYTHIQNDTNLLFINKLNDSKFYSHSTQFFTGK